MRSRIAANNSRGTATSAIWNVTYLKCRTTFAPILISFSRSVVSDQCFTDLGDAIRDAGKRPVNVKTNNRHGKM